MYSLITREETQTHTSLASVCEESQSLTNYARTKDLKDFSCNIHNTRW